MSLDNVKCQGKKYFLKISKIIFTNNNLGHEENLLECDWESLRDDCTGVDVAGVICS